MNVWWLIVRTPAGGHTWEVGDPGPAGTENLVVRAKTLLGWPHDDRPGDGWDLSLAPGEPHPSLRAKCVHREVADLLRVTDAAVQVWAADDAAARHESEVAAVQAAIARMPVEQQTALRTRLGWSPAPQPMGGGKT